MVTINYLRIVKMAWNSWHKIWQLQQKSIRGERAWNYGGPWGGVFNCLNSYKRGSNVHVCVEKNETFFGGL